MELGGAGGLQELPGATADGAGLTAGAAQICALTCMFYCSKSQLIHVNFQFVLNLKSNLTLT